MEFYFWRVFKKEKPRYSEMSCNFVDIVDFVVSTLFTASIKSDNKNLCWLSVPNSEIQNMK